MFIGEYLHSIDAKGRLSVPAKFRLGLDQKAVVTRGLDQCLVLYPKEDWERLAEKISSLPISEKKSRVFSRFILGGATEVEFDQNGRILLPQYLREYARIEGQAVVVGLYNRIEIWNKDQWEKLGKENESETAKLAEEIGI